MNIKKGQFYRYTPKSDWCHEGIAEVKDGGMMLDTYWGTSANYENQLSPDERETAELLFDADDYDELDQYSRASESQWEQYNPADRQRVTSQHGLCARYFVRKGSKPDLETKIANAERRLREAQDELRSAQRSVKWREEELAELSNQRANI